MTGNFSAHSGTVGCFLFVDVFDAAAFVVLEVDPLAEADAFLEAGPGFEAGERVAVATAAGFLVDEVGFETDVEAVAVALDLADLGGDLGTGAADSFFDCCAIASYFFFSSSFNFAYSFAMNLVKSCPSILGNFLWNLFLFTSINFCMEELGFWIAGFLGASISSSPASSSVESESSSFLSFLASPYNKTLIIFTRNHTLMLLANLVIQFLGVRALHSLG